MSVTVADIMKLPCLHEAEILAGKGGLSKIVSSISVLEYAEVSALKDELFSNNEFYGSEIVITGFINIKDDIEAQCDNLRRLSEVGEVGLILYYVGIFMPQVDQRLIDLADSLDFPLICMPRNRMNLRYSEVICEVMEAIYKDQMTKTYFVSEILERISHLPEHQRSIDTVLKMLSDRIRASVILTDASLHILNSAAWPRTLEIKMGSIHRHAKNPIYQQAVQISQDQTLYTFLIDDKSGSGMKLFILKDGDPLKNYAVGQAAELVQLSVNLWSQHHGGMEISELIRAILKDEPIKMRRLADIFKIDVASINTMWVIVPELNYSNTEEQRQQELKICNIAKDFLSGHYRTMIADVYDHTIVTFMDSPIIGQSGISLSNLLYEQLSHSGFSCHLMMCYDLRNTSEVRQSYLAIEEFLETAKKIYPEKRVFTSQEIFFARNCHDIIASGEEAIKQKLSVLDCLNQVDAGVNQDLTTTLAVYLLDSDSSVSLTAEKMFLHRNTIKYRIGKINERLHVNVTKMPEAFSLYLASALHRILDIR